MENQTLEETQEETQTEPIETETQEETSEETSEETVEKDTSKTSETVDYEKKFKESQKEAIRLKKENDDFRKEPKPSNPANEPVADVDAIVEVQQATKGLSPSEIAELRLRASVNKTTLSEARKDENFVLWQKAYKEKVELSEQTLSPSTRQGVTKRKIPISEIGTSKEDIATKEKFLKEAGWKK